MTHREGVEGMPEYLAPGVFVEEIDSGSKPIEGVGVNTAAFIGYAKSGAFNRPTFVSNWSQFCQLFGEEENALTRALCAEFHQPAALLHAAKRASRQSWFQFAQLAIKKRADEGGVSFENAWRQFLNKHRIPQHGQPYLEGTYLAHAVRGYYENGGTRAFIVRVPTDNDMETLRLQANGKEPGKMAERPRLAVGNLTLELREGVEADRDITVDVQSDPAPDAKQWSYTVRRGDEVVERLPKDEQAYAGPGSAAKIINDESSLFQVVETARRRTVTAEQPAAQSYVLARPVEAGSLAAATPGANGLARAVLEFEKELAQLEPEEFMGDEAKRSGTRGLVPIAEVNFICVPDLMAGLWVRDELPQETALIEGLAKELGLTADDVRTARSASGKGLMEFARETIQLEVRQRTASPGDGGVVRSWQGFLDRYHLTAVYGDQPVGPEQLRLSEARKEAIITNQRRLIDHCEEMGNRMAILDPIPDLRPDEMNTLSLMNYNSDHGQATIYYPWVKIADPINKGQLMLVPPCGHVAGVWARVVVERGVHKAPANESLFGVVDLEYDVTKGEQELLNPNGINCIRSFPGRGIRVWGARTLATVGNPSWKYVNVRRLFNYLEQSLERNLQWVVFEPNDHDLWGRVSRNITAFLFTEWKEGKLFGTVPAEAFFVRCNAETNPQEMIDLGRMYCEIGVNPVKPAEFVIIRIGQWSGGGSITEQ
jgi:phage tail sheath protein FI